MSNFSLIIIGDEELKETQKQIWDHSESDKMKMKNYVFFLLCTTTVLVESQNNELFKDCTRELYDRVVRFEYLYYEGYWMYPYNKLRNHGPSYHYTERDFCK